MKLLTAALNRLPEFQQLLAALEGGRCPVALSGVSAIHRVHIAAGIGLLTQRPVVLVCADESEGERLAQDLAAFAETSVPVLTPRSLTFHLPPMGAQAPDPYAGADPKGASLPGCHH